MATAVHNGCSGRVDGAGGDRRAGAASTTGRGADTTGCRLRMFFRGTFGPGWSRAGRRIVDARGYSRLEVIWQSGMSRLRKGDHHGVCETARLHPAAGQSARHEAERPRRGYFDPGRPPNRRDPQGARHPRRGRREPLSGIASWGIGLGPQSPDGRPGRTEPQGSHRGLPRRGGASRPAGTGHRPVSRSRRSRRGPGLRQLPEARDHPVFRIDSNPGR